MIPSLKKQSSFACLSSHFLADDKRLKLKEVSQGKVFIPKAGKRVNTKLKYHVCLNNQHRVKQLLLYTLEIKTGHYPCQHFANMLPTSCQDFVCKKISIKRCRVNVVQS